MTRTGFVATSGDGSDCGHLHRSRQTAEQCLRRNQIFPSRADVRQEAQEHGLGYREYAQKWARDMVYFRDASGNLIR